MPGWTAQITKVTLDKPIKVHDTEIKEAVSTVTWTATAGTRINPGEFQEFELSAGPLPETEQLVIPAIQTYDNGTVVAWDAPPVEEGAEEPEHPAPVIELEPAGEDAPRRLGRAGERARPSPRTVTTTPTTPKRPRRPPTTPHAGSAVPASWSARSASGSASAPTLRARRAVAANRGGQS